jgi:pSer/pThr/pTyr-binding forkhead associated (FHA) protein/ribosomal protein L40E
VITCPKCFKENQDHYKFCLGCGAELPRDASPKKFAPGTPPHGVPQARAIAPIADEVTSQGGLEPKAIAPRPKAGMGTAAMAASPAAPAPAPAAPPPAPIPQPVVAAPAPVVAAPPPVVAAPPPAAAAPAAAAGGTGIICPQCEHPNPGNNKFCASCGFKLSRPAAAAAAPEVSAIQAAPAVALSGVILTALRADGTEAGTYPLPAGNTTVGRDTGAIFAGDSYLSPRHATFSPRGAKLFVKDEGSLNGVYKKLRRDEPVLINPNDIFRIGQELLRYEPLTPLPATADGVDRLGSPSKGYMGRISLIIGRDATGNAFPVPEAGMHLGRERGDVLFPEDGYVSGLHCRLAFTNGQLFLTDLGSSNGSFVRLNGEAEVIDGDILLMGQQLFRIGT